MHFLQPKVLWLLLIVMPLFTLVAYMTFYRYWRTLQAYSEQELALVISRPLAVRRYWLSSCLFLLSMVLLVVATARPVVSDVRAEVVRGTADVIALVDVSRSMAAEDYKGKLDGIYAPGTRLHMARYLIANNLLPAVQGNQLGLVSYAGEAAPQSFLTDDMPSLKWVVKNWLTINSAPGDGSAMAKSFELAFQLFALDSLPSRRKIIVLFSDGGNDETAESIDNIVQAVKKLDIELVVVGLGRNTPVRIPVSQLSRYDKYVQELRTHGKQWYEVKDEIVTTKLDSQLLRHLANRVGGTYREIVYAEDFNFSNLIASLEATYKLGVKEIFFYPLIGAVICSVLAMFLVRQRKRK
jgi:Ca-activated chloride channel family protein